jgi:hypothetical protein
MMISKALLLLLVVLVSLSNAFNIPTQINHIKVTSSTTSSLSMKFLKDLGFEKPSWLPDFGKKGEDENTKSEEQDSTVVNADEKPSENQAVAQEE